MYSDFDPEAVDKFWHAWDSLATDREILLRESQVDWPAVKKSLIQANMLLSTCPDRQIQRIVRLSKLPLDFDLAGEDRLIYIIYGHCPPYVGPTGRITGPWRLLQRFREHIRKAKRLKNLFTGLRHRRAIANWSTKCMPSLAKFMARDGPTRFSIMGVKIVPKGLHGGVPERRWVQTLAITTNGRMPFGGLDRVRWNTILAGGIPKVGGTDSLLYHILDRGGNITPEQGLALATQVGGHYNVNLFEKYFRVLSKIMSKNWKLRLLRRIVLRVPSYNGRVLKSCNSLARAFIDQLDLPASLKQWYRHVVTVIPPPSPSATSAVGSLPSSPIPSLVCGILYA